MHVKRAKMTSAGLCLNQLKSRPPQRAVALLIVLLNFRKLITDGENIEEAFLICSDVRFESLPTAQKVHSGHVLVNMQKKTKQKGSWKGKIKLRTLRYQR